MSAGELAGGFGFGHAVRVGIGRHGLVAEPLREAETLDRGERSFGASILFAQLGGQFRDHLESIATAPPGAGSAQSDAVEPQRRAGPRRRSTMA